MRTRTVVVTAGRRRPGANRRRCAGFVANLDVDLLVHDRVDEHRRKARVPSRISVEWRNPNEPMDARLRAQESVRVLSADLEHRALDARLFAFTFVEDADLEAAAFGPPDVHPHQHLGPVLRFGSAGAGADLELRVAKIVRTSKERSQPRRLDLVMARLISARALASSRVGPVLKDSPSSRALSTRPCTCVDPANCAAI